MSEEVELAVAFRFVGGEVEISWEAGIGCSVCMEGIAGLVWSCCFRRLFSRFKAAFSCFRVRISVLIACNSFRISVCAPGEDDTCEVNDDDGALGYERWQLTFDLLMPNGGCCVVSGCFGGSGRPLGTVSEVLIGCNGGKSVARRVAAEAVALAYETADRRGW